MTSALQNRLVGTIIVVALVVIVLPEFLDGEKRTNNQEFVDIPPVAQLVEVKPTQALDVGDIAEQVNRPVEVINETAVDEQTDPAVDALQSNNTVATQTPPEQEDALPTQSTPTQSTPTQSSTDNSDTPAQQSNANEATRQQANNEEALAQIDIKDSGWVVQLGSFRHEKNVKELLKTLNDAGYRAYSRPVLTSVGELTKVFVGPELEKQTLELALPHLQEITKLKGKITAFEVSAG